MSYIGRQPIVGNYQVLDPLTASATATYALTKASVAVFPQTPANCIVSLNGVIQAPFDSYTISGSNIVFASALTASDSIDFITVLGDVLNVGTVSDGTITTDKLANTSVTPAKMDLSQNYTFTGAVSGHNYPAFFATMSADQTGIPDSTFTKIQFNTERFDTDSAYDATTNYRFTVPTGLGGKYFFSSCVYIDQVSSSQTFGNIDYAFYKNGAQNVYSGYSFLNYNPKAYNVSVNAVLDLSAGDYVEMYIYSDTTSGATFVINQNTTTLARCFWYGFRIGA